MPKKKRENLSTKLDYDSLENRKVLNGDLGYWVEYNELLDNLETDIHDIEVRELNVETGAQESYPLTDLVGDSFFKESGQTEAVQGELSNEIQDFIFGSEDRTRIGRSDILSNPYIETGQIFFDKPANTSICSGTMVSPFHVLTAAHCVSDGDSNFYSNFRFHPSKDTASYKPHGEARATWIRHFSGYTGGNSDWDIALLTLDRNLGTSQFLGHMGFGFNTASSFYSGNTGQIIGYPGDTPDGSTQTMWQVSGNAVDNGITTHSLRTDTMDITGGMSGGPLHYSRTVHGVVSHGNYTDSNGNGEYDPGEPTHYNSQTRITESKFNALQSWISDDQTARPPSDRADLISVDRWFNSSNDSTDKSVLTPSESFNASFAVRNIGTEAAGSYTIRFRLSDNDQYDVDDTFLGDYTVSSQSAMSTHFGSKSLTIPSSFSSSGNFHIVYKIDVANTVNEFTNSEGNDPETNNEGSIDDPVFILIDSNDQISEAVNFDVGTTIFGSVSSGNDVDMYSFTTTAGSRVGIDIDIAGQDLDSWLRLFDSNGVELLESDDDVGPGDEPHFRESYLEYTIPTDGTYYFGISAFSNSNYDPITGAGDTSGSTTGGYEAHLDFVDPDDQVSESLAIFPGETFHSELTFPQDVQVWAFAAVAGERYDIDIDIPDQVLDSYLRLFDANGTQIDASDDDVGYGSEPHFRESYLEFVAPSTGIYYLGVSAFGNSGYNVNTGREDGDGTTIGTYSISLKAVSLVDTRDLFYANSSFGTEIAFDKTPLLPGGTATFQNYTSYIHGITGLTIDADLAADAVVGVNDFEFRFGNVDNVDSWGTINPSVGVSVQRGAGANGLDRIDLTFANGEITNGWLQVRFVANDNTGLREDDVFYFGNAIGETGNNPADARVNLIDVGLARSNQTSFTLANVDNDYDFNRDGRVNLIDVGLARANQTAFSSVQLITPTSSTLARNAQVVGDVAAKKDQRAITSIARSHSVDRLALQAVPVFPAIRLEDLLSDRSIAGSKDLVSPAAFDEYFSSMHVENESDLTIGGVRDPLDTVFEKQFDSQLQGVKPQGYAS
jgi:V8-like Glu-specific endopeptidase